MSVVHERLQRNIALNGWTMWSALRTLSGRAPARPTFSSPPWHPVEFQSFVRVMRSADGELTSTRVPVITIDGFVRERQLERVDLIKVDTESTEPQVLRGGERGASEVPADGCLRGPEGTRQRTVA
jgi:FkbM family methyltransferase